jgi:hypothetical protein
MRRTEIATPMTAYSAQGRYEQLSTLRAPFLRRAEEAARLTIPTLLPPEGATGSTELPQPWQSVGARGISNLAAKALLALFPPGTSFFKLAVDDFLLEKLAELLDVQEGEDARAKIDAALARVERAVVGEMEQAGSRATLYDTLRHLLAPGNVLLHLADDGKMRNFYLNTYCVKRDGMGQPVEIVVKETLSRQTLPPEALQILERNEECEDGEQPHPTCNLYTHLRLVGKKWEVYQEVAETRIPGTEGTYPKDACPWIALRFSRIDGEDYGRGMVEEYMGDLRSLESLSQSIVEFAAIASTVKFLVDPGGQTRAEDLARSRNGAFKKGSAKDVTVVSLDKYADFRVAKEVKTEIEQRLGEAFLLGSAVRRDAERVTAEEIRVIAAELETALGGFYSVLGMELQLPLVSRLLYQMARSKKLPPLPKEVKPSIITGMEALGRGSELAKLDALFASTAQTFGQEAVAQSVKVNAYMLRGATALGLDIGGMVRTDDELEAMQQQATAQSMAEKLGPTAMRQQQQEMPQDG